MQHNYVQIAENYLANEVLPKLKNSTTGQPFENMSFDKDDIISGAIEEALPIIRSPQIWEGKTLSIPQIKLTVDKIVGFIIKKIMYPTASRATNNPQEMTFTDAFGKDISGLIPDDYQKPNYMPTVNDFNKFFDNIKKYLNAINPEYTIILQHLLFNKKHKKTPWREILNNIDNDLGHKIERKDINNMIIAIRKYFNDRYVIYKNKLYEVFGDNVVNVFEDWESIHFIKSIMNYIISTLIESMHYVAGNYYRQKHSKKPTWFQKSNPNAI